jgi:phage virion morphogenesis protein
VTYQVEIDDTQVLTALAKLQAKAADLTPAMRAIGAGLRDNIRLGFRDGRDPWGTAWAPLSAVTRALRRGNGATALPLLDTGLLLGSINFNATKDSVEVGSADNAGKALMQQFGGTTAPNSMIPGKRIPARPYLPIRNQQADLPAEWREEVVGLLRRHIGAALP